MITHQNKPGDNLLSYICIFSDISRTVTGACRILHYSKVHWILPNESCLSPQVLPQRHPLGKHSYADPQLGHITTDTDEIQRTKKCLKTCILTNKKMCNFLGIYSLLKLNHDQINHLNRNITPKETEAVFKIF